MEREIRFDPKEVDRLFKPDGDSKNGQITIIGGSELFHGAPLLSLTTASRVVDIVFFSSPDPSVGAIAELLKSKLSSFIWVPFDEVEKYIEKTDSTLIGPGLMRYRREGNQVEDDAWKKTRDLTKRLLTQEYKKEIKWVIDAGSLQVLEKDWIPKGAILTPNKKEYALLFGDMDPKDASQKYNCTIVLKGIIDKVCTNGECVVVEGGNAGMAKGGTGDTLAGLTVALFAKNEAQLSASAASFITKKAGDTLYEKARTNFNADDLANKVPEILGRLQGK